jgi:hypothetical protein
VPSGGHFGSHARNVERQAGAIARPCDQFVPSIC